MSIKISRYPVCRQNLTNGRRCKSLAMTTSAFCYHHQKVRRTRPRLIDVPPAPALVRFDPLRDPGSLRHALSLVLKGVASNQITSRAAGRMLSAIETAFTELKQNPDLSPNPFESDTLPGVYNGNPMQ